MSSELAALRIDRNKKRGDRPSRWATWWILIGVGALLLLGAASLANGIVNRATEVEIVRVKPAAVDDVRGGDVILNSTGYVVAAHTIELAAKVVGKVAWIGVDKGYHVKEGQALVRLEDDDYKAQVMQARGNLINLQAQLDQLVNGSRPEEIAKAKADLDNAVANEQDAKVTLDRTRPLTREGVLTKQNLDDAQAKYDSAAAQRQSLQRTYELVKLGPRKEQIDAARGMVEQAKGQLAYAQVMLDNTVIRAPVTGTILERNVEKGEFVTTGFVGDKGAKGYVVSMADLNDLKVELDINQNDFAKLGPRQKGIVTTDAFPDRKYDGYIDEVSPEANRQKATVQVKVKITHPDDYLRPEMNASVAFIADAKPKPGEAVKPAIVIPASAVRGDSVFVASNGRAVKRAVKLGGTVANGVRIEDGLIGGEDLIANPPADLKDGDRVKPKA